MKVDIIMRTKDRPIFLERAIKDVIDQSYKNWFLCIVNDGRKAFEVDKILQKWFLLFKIQRNRICQQKRKYIDFQHI